MTGCLQPATTSLRRATALDRQILRTARERCERQLRRGRRSMVVGLLLGPAALVAACCVDDPSTRWPLLIAAAIEIGLVPSYTTLACRRLRYLIALIDLDLEEGLVEHGIGRVRKLFGIWQVLEDTNRPRVRFAPAGLSRFRGLQPGAAVAYRFAPRSRVAVWIERGEANRWRDEVGRGRPSSALQPGCRSDLCLTRLQEGVA